MQVMCAHTEMRDIINMVPHPRNPNKHPDKQLKLLAKIMKHQGWRHPITISKQSGYIVAGHGRLDAAKLNGWDSAPVDVQDFANEADEFAHLIADNKIAELADHDEGFMIEGIKDLEISDFELLGMEDFELPLEPDAVKDEIEDDVPTDVETRCKLGDVWLLGDHRLMCGDATSVDAVDKLMAGEKADMVFTSPPYNGNTHLDYGKGNNEKLYRNDSDNKDSKEYVKFCHDVLSLLFLHTNGFIFWNVNYNANSRYEYIQSIYPYIESLHETVIWKKTGMPLSSGLTRNTEFIFVFKNGDRKHLGETFKTEFTFWDISNANSQDKDHKACFPVELPEKGISLGSSEENIVLDPFGGSGSTLIACEKTNRKCFMMELDPHYCDVILSRWEQYAGKTATLCGV